eukprot:1161195-Pelagomonas_calceolata.AAC.24
MDVGIPHQGLRNFLLKRGYLGPRHCVSCPSRKEKSPQERVWCWQVYERAEQNGYEASKQAWWLYECQGQAL